MNQIVGHRLKKARLNKNLSQIDVMERTNINNKTLSGYENGVSEPDFQTLKVLADLYEVTTDYLIGVTNNPESLRHRNTIEEQWPEGVKVLRRAHSKLTPEKRKKMLRLIETYILDEEDET